MRKLIPLLLCGILTASCIDKDYDLGNIKTDDITIGGETSEYKMPLAKVEVSLSEISGDGINVQDILADANIWLPTDLPGNKDYVELDRLQNDPNYINTLLDALIDEMAEGTTDKMDKVLDHIWDNQEYQDEFLPLLNLPGNIDIDKLEPVFKLAFKSQFATNTAIHNQAKTEAGKYLTEISIEALTYEINNIDLGSDVVDMLADNLDPKGTPNAKNTLSIYGEIDSKLPLSVRFDPTFVSSQRENPSEQGTPEDKVLFTIGNLMVEADGDSKIPETRIYEEDIRAIVGGSAKIIVPVQLMKYYPKKDFRTDIDKQVVINLRIVKRGGLKLDL